MSYNNEDNETRSQRRFRRETRQWRSYDNIFKICVVIFFLVIIFFMMFFAVNSLNSRCCTPCCNTQCGITQPALPTKNPVAIRPCSERDVQEYLKRGYIVSETPCALVPRNFEPDNNITVTPPQSKVDIDKPPKEPVPVNKNNDSHVGTSPTIPQTRHPPREPYMPVTPSTSSFHYPIFLYEPKKPVIAINAPSTFWLFVTSTAALIIIYKLKG